MENEYLFASRDRYDATVMCIRSVRSRRYRYTRNLMPEVSFTVPNLYNETMYPVSGLVKELHAAGGLTPAQATLRAPRRPDAELYDLESDLWEIHNLADSTDPEHQRVKNGLATILESWIEETGDRGRNPEPEELIQEIREKNEAPSATWTPSS